MFTTPEQTLTQLKAVNDEIANLVKIQDGLKRELEEHYSVHSINDKFSYNGISATRCCKEGKWLYSESTQQLILTKKEEIEDQMEKERQAGIAKQNDPTFYWTVRGKKK